jgi:hypothetical protein
MVSVAVTQPCRLNQGPIVLGLPTEIKFLNIFHNLKKTRELYLRVDFYKIGHLILYSNVETFKCLSD